jgi:hypothetical protein
MQRRQNGQFVRAIPCPCGRPLQMAIWGIADRSRYPSPTLTTNPQSHTGLGIPGKAIENKIEDRSSQRYAEHTALAVKAAFTQDDLSRW